MILNRIKLENIRSYLNQEINFPEGSVLLNGDVGSGKSSVLLGIDFALFGLTKGVLSGSSLLRNGAKSGSVELYFGIDGKNLIVKRTLKRNENSVVQDYGFVLVDGMKKEGTASEIKARVLELLNYPKELLTKSKGLIYRYTVYTPQDEMKRILLGKKEERLEILRKVFDIDKYKRIKDNCDVFVKNLRGKIREFNGRISDLSEKEKMKNEKGVELEEVKKVYEEVLKKVDLLKSEVEKGRNRLKDIEEKIKELNNLKNRLEINEANLNYKIEEKKDKDEKLKVIEKEVLEGKKELESESIGNLERDFLEKKKKKEEEIFEIEKKLMEIGGRIKEISVMAKNSEDVIDKISRYDKCPTCFQDISEEYKERIVNFEKEKGRKYLEDGKRYSEIEKDIGDNLLKLKKELEGVNKDLNGLEIKKLKLSSLKDKEMEIEKIKKDNLKLKEEIGKINLEKLELFKKIERYSKIEEEYRNEKENFDKLMEKQINIETKKGSFEEKLKLLKINILNLENEINEKLKVKKNLDYLNQLENWVEKSFFNIMNIMEKNIMIKLQQDFNSLFQKWFDIIIANENISVKLDEEFTPIITQNGYEIDYLHLSGGEKTAAALAYRLALNQVINNLMSEVKTKDLIILDEPTDGFSSEQLDRVKLVLDELEIKQIIIVSHENKIESFVDNVLSFEKKEHVSRVV